MPPIQHHAVCAVYPKLCTNRLADEAAKEKILQVIKSHNLSPRIGVVLVLSVDKDKSVPELGFGARAVRFLADIGAFINVEYKLSARI